MRPDYFHKIKFVSMNAKIIEENSELSFSVMFICRDVAFICGAVSEYLEEKNDNGDRPVGGVCRYCAWFGAVCNCFVKRRVE